METFTLEEGDVDLDLFNEWVPALLTAHGEQLYRLKGLLAVKGDRRRFVCQGVHMTFTGERGAAWGAEPRKSTLVFIGKAPLPQAEIASGFRKCVAR